MIAISDPCGPQGQLVLDELLRQVPAASVVAIVSRAHEAASLRLRGVQVREVRPDRPELLPSALAGVERLLLVGAAMIGRPPGNLQPLVDAARAAGVHQVVYTSVLHADSSALPIAAEHRKVETALRIVGVPHVLLRQGACVEDYIANVPAALEYHAVLGCAGMGGISCASRHDYASAAAAVLLAPVGQPRVVFELAGRSVFTMPELAAEIGRQAGQAVRYVHLPSTLYRAALVDAGVNAEQAQQLVDADVAAAHGALLGDEPDLERLIGRRAMTLQQAVAAGLEGCRPRPASGRGCSEPADSRGVELFA